MKQLSSTPIINVIPGMKDSDDDDLLDSDDKANTIASNANLGIGQSVVPSFALSSEAKERAK